MLKVEKGENKCSCLSAFSVEGMRHFKRTFQHENVFERLCISKFWFF